MRRFSMIAVAGALGFGLAGCSTVYPLKSVAYRESDSRLAEQDVSVDIAGQEVAGLKKLAWIAYSTTFECPKDCPYTLEERRELAREISDQSFSAFDRELRRALAQERELADNSAVTSSEAFGRVLKTDSFKKTVSRWITRLGLAAAPEVVAPAARLKSVDPSEIGWSGAQSLADLGKALGVDGVLVGHVRVTLSEDKSEPKRLIVHGPRLWLFSSSSAVAVAVAGLKPVWRLDPATPADPEMASAVAKLNASHELQSQPRLDWRGFDAVASGFGARFSQAMNDE